MATAKTARERTTMEKNEDRLKMTIYIPSSLAKRFKMLAIALDLDYSELSEKAFSEYVEQHSNELLNV